MATKTVIDNSVPNKCKVIFKVDNYTNVLQNNISNVFPTFKSDIFTISSNKLQISIEYTSKDITIYFHLVETSKSSVSFQYDMYIMDSNNKIYGKQNKNATIYRNIGSGLTFTDKQQLMDNKELLLPNNALTVGVDITVLKNGICNKCFKFDHLIGVRKLSDCQLIVGKDKKEFYASKLVLSARSEVFQNMFTNDCLEKSSNKVIIDDIDSDVFEIFLRYLYTGECDQLDEWYDKLLIVADKYLVESLKTLCLNEYYEKINVENAMKILKLFQDFSANKDLMLRTYGFVVYNVGSLFSKLIGKHYEINAKSVAEIGKRF
ncbi:speckle-type POZ protein-like [Oppia nitens]|uniref:speckle-type POZ protein-like n=1 Tax=Oppia nitens TaxID=1686743 RepID=UPI0023DA813C|nr:speckle-type POZ protein-like [Oppia nitens]